MADERIPVINKPEFLEVSNCDFYSHLSFLNNIVDVDKLDILMDKNDVTHSEANTSDLERYINQKFDEVRTRRLYHKNVVHVKIGEP